MVLAAASVDASGTSNGGLIRVGGDFKGANPNIRNAQTTFVNGATTLKANGANGKVVVWSDDKTDFYGNIIATGNGSAEVSSKGTLTYGGNAALGAVGALLLDPANIIIDNTAGPAAFALQDPNAFAGKQFGSSLTLLGTTTGNTFTQNGKVVVAAGTDNLGGANAGAVYLFDTNTGALISTLVGSTANDFVGGAGVIALTNGNYVVISSQWGAAKGAVTWGSGTAGVVGAVSAANSLVGSTANDFIGSSGVAALTNGNYVVGSQNWNGDMGAATWGSGTAGVSGAVSAANSLVGSTASDFVGSGVTALSNGNYVVASSSFAGNTGQVLIGTPGNIGFDTASGQTLRINPSGISATLAGGTAVTLQASNDITVNSNIMVAGMAGGAFTLQAGRSINLNSVITTANGNFTASAGDAAATGPGRMAGDAAINQAAGSSINAGTGVVTLLVNGKSINSSGSSSSSSSSNAVTTASATDTPQFVSALQSVYQPSRQEPGSTGDSPFGNIGRVDPLVVLNAAANDE